MFSTFFLIYSSKIHNYELDSETIIAEVYLTHPKEDDNADAFSDGGEATS